MISLILDNHDVVISSTDNIKLCRCNQNIATSGDYTLDVNVPLSVITNRLFFGSLQRLETCKEPRTYAARMYINNICIMNGSAKITAINSSVIQLQLYGDRSEFNAIFGDRYIDELPLPFFNKSTTAGWAGKRSYTRSENQGEEDLQISYDIAGPDTFIFSSVYNEYADEIVNMHTVAKMLDGNWKKYSHGRKVAQFNLLYVIRHVFKSIGYKIDFKDFDKEPYNRMYIACCITSAQMIHVLPHWNLREFVEQLQLFLNATFFFSSSEMYVKIVDNNKLYAGGSSQSSYECDGDFKVEIDNGGVESINTSNIHYDLSSSQHHDIDSFDEMRMDEMPTKQFESYEQLEREYYAMQPNVRDRFLFRCPEGDYCSWLYQSANDTEQNKKKKLLHINHFGDVIRDKQNGNTIDLKICPVAIATAVPVQLYYESKRPAHGGGNRILPAEDQFCYMEMPSLEGKSDGKESKGYFGNSQNSQEIIIEKTDIQDLIQSSESIEKYEKPDRMELFFWDETTTYGRQYEYNGGHYPVDVPAVFTAYDLKNINDVQHQPWSLSFKTDRPGVQTLASLHKNIKIKDKVRYTINFVSQKIPKADDIFIFQNKKFIAEKLEIIFKDGEMDSLIRGYFFEIE